MASIKSCLLGAVMAAPALAAVPHASRDLFGICNIQTATFDDLVAAPAAAVPIGVYKGLNYPAFDIASGGVAGLVVTGIVPASSPNFAGYGIYNEITAGSVPQITTSGTSTKSFQLNQFRFACAVNTAETALGVPTPCTVTVNGYNTLGRQVYTQSFDFNPGPGAVRSQMATATLQFPWTGLSSVTFDTTNAEGAATGTVVDNVVYCLQS